METMATLNSSSGDSGLATDGQSSVPERHFLNRHSLSPLDYCLFATMLTFSALIGVYFAFFAKTKQNSTSEYLMGGKTMGITPVSMSLIASWISGITLLGMPAEIYTYGTQYCAILIGLISASLGCGIIFMPVFYRLQLNTSYEYLEIRFNRKVRLLGSILYIISSLLYIPIVIYMPALASSQVTGINLHLITPLLCIVCIFYTSLGGLKAVVWTDVLQTTLMLGAVLIVVSIGTNAVGGIEVVWERNEGSGRLEFFNFDPHLTVRHTFWNTAFGSIFTWCSQFSLNQSMVQRFLCMPSINRAQILVVTFSIGIVLITGISFYVGLLIYALYYECDPVSANAVRASDQLLPYFVMDVVGSFQGLPGLFMAGVFSAALSTMSTGLNSMSGVIYEDFIHPFLKVQMTEERASFLMKIICVVIGVFCFCMVFVVENLGAVTQVSESLAGVTSGPMLAIFILGMFFPWANAKGTLVGGLTGLVVMGYIAFGTQVAISNGQIKFDKKPVSLEGCSFLPQGTFATTETFNATTNPFSPPTMEETAVAGEGPSAIFLLSYTLYSLLGLVITVVVGLVVSAMTGPNDPAKVHLDLLTPIIHPLFVHRCKGGDRTAKLKKVDKFEASKEGEDVHNLLICRSTRLWEILTRHVSSLTVKPLSQTRWESRIHAFKPLRYELGNSYDALIEISDDTTFTGSCGNMTCSDANALANGLSKFKFVTSLILWHNILFAINLTSKQLQEKN